MKKTILFGAVFAILLTADFANAANIFDIEGGEATTVGIYIKSLTDGQIIVDENASLALTPASVTKAVTSATALNLLGPDFRFSTPVILTGRRSESNKSIWEGNLEINASGDPTIENPDLKMNMWFTDSIIAGVKRLGITKITGTIIIKEDMSGAGPIAQWEVEDIAWPYGAGLYGFNYAGNYVRVYPNTSTTIPASNLKIEVRSADRTDLLRGVGSENLIVWTSQKNRQNPKWNVNATIPNPAAVYSNLLKSKLNAAGITISDRQANVNGSQITSVYTHFSPKLLDICRDLMKRSDNLFAEGMLRALLPGESREKCLKKEREFWTSQGLEAKYNIINDGSGLTRANRISPIFLGSMLEKMAFSEYAEQYVDFFPVAGVDGTLKSFLEKTRLKGRLAMKTGSVSSVQTYAGYKLDSEGQPTHVVVVMVNGFFCSRAALRKKIESYLLNIFDNQSNL